MTKLIEISRIVAVCLSLSFMPLPIAAQSSAVVFKGATIVDGSGRPPYIGDVRIRSGKIEKIGRIKQQPGDRTINAAGKVIAPGFIDIHNHSEAGLLREGTATNQVSQGITTLIVGPDGGSQPRAGTFYSMEDLLKPLL